MIHHVNAREGTVLSMSVCMFLWTHVEVCKNRGKETKRGNRIWKVKKKVMVTPVKHPPLHRRGRRVG